MKDQIYLYPLWIRIWHVVNALLFIALIFSGLSLQYSNNTFNLLPFDFAVSMHNISGITLSIAFVFFLFWNHFSGNGEHYRIKSKGYCAEVFRQFRYYAFGIFKNEKPPFPITEEQKFNPLQKFTYVMVMYVLLPLITLTGLGLFFPDILPDRMLGTTGIHFVDLIHIVTGFLLSIFMIIHIYFCTIGRTCSANFKSMITGWH